MRSDAQAKWSKEIQHLCGTKEGLRELLNSIRGGLERHGWLLDREFPQRVSLSALNLVIYCICFAERSPAYGCVCVCVCVLYARDLALQVLQSGAEDFTKANRNAVKERIALRESNPTCVPSIAGHLPATYQQSRTCVCMMQEQSAAKSAPSFVGAMHAAHMCRVP